MPAFDDGYRKTVCLLGTGATCCRYLLLGPGGWSCGKLSSLRATIDERASKMTAQGDNCEGLLEVT